MGYPSQSCLQDRSREGQEEACLERRVLCAVHICSAHEALSTDNALPLAGTGHFKLNALQLPCSQMPCSSQAGVRGHKSFHAFIIAAGCPWLLILPLSCCRHCPDCRQIIEHQLCIVPMIPNILTPTIIKIKKARSWWPILHLPSWRPHHHPVSPGT